MKLATIRFDGQVYAGVVRDEDFVPLQNIDHALPGDMMSLIQGYDAYGELIKKGISEAKALCNMKQVEYLPPLPNPGCFRDFMGYAEHFENCMKNVNAPVPEKYYKMPVFYFSNHRALYGSGEPVKAQPSSQCRDFEFEIGFIIGKEGRDIPASQAMDHIFGFTILNDWSARDLQTEEMTVGLGPAKGKDYATSLGPVIVTRDELSAKLCPDDPTRLDLATKLSINGKVIRENNTKSILHSFASMIERASRDVTVYVGDLFGSGTLGGGTICEYSQDEVPYLKPGDRIEMKVEGIGTLLSLVK